MTGCADGMCVGRVEERGYRDVSTGQSGASYGIRKTEAKK